MGTYKYKYNWNFFNKQSEELYYFLGFIAADGYISNNEIEIGLNESDKDLLDKFKILICPDKTHAYVLKISCKNKISHLKKFFSMTTNKKAEEIRFPNIPCKYVKDFIRGYVDGDGCIDTTKGYYKNNIYIGPRIRILGNYDFLKEMNKSIKKTINHNTNAVRKKSNENVYCLTYNFSTAKKILKWLYKDCSICLQRKYDRAKKCSKAW